MSEETKKPEVTTEVMEMEDEYGHEFTMTISQCMDCGAHCEGSPDNLVHHNTCIPGEAEKWKKHYEDFDAEMRANPDTCSVCLASLSEALELICEQIDCCGMESLPEVKQAFYENPREPKLCPDCREADEHAKSYTSKTATD